MDISPYYIDARNSLTQPDRMVFLSQYFRRSWMPALGPLGTAIVIYLRGACYYNRKTGETRDTIQIGQREIAAGCGCSVPTIKRELERNEALRRFVQISPEWERDGASGRVRQLENHYKIAMDDPLTEADEARLEAMVQERIGREQQDHHGQGERPRKQIRLKETARIKVEQTESGLTACSKTTLPSVHTAELDECSNAVCTACSTSTARAGDGKRLPIAGPRDQNELLRPGDQSESTPVQNELLYIDSLLQTTKENKEQTLNVSRGIHSVTGELELSAAAPPSARQSAFEDGLEAQATRVAAELHDRGSERRHRQLLSICDQHGLSHLCVQALDATRHRLARERKHGPLERPGAYYQRVLIKLLEGHQVFVPTAGEDDAEEVRRLAKLSLGLEP